MFKRFSFYLAYLFEQCCRNSDSHFTIFFNNVFDFIIICIFRNSPYDVYLQAYYILLNSCVTASDRGRPNTS